MNPKFLSADLGSLIRRLRRLTQISDSTDFVGKLYTDRKHANPAEENRPAAVPRLKAICQLTGVDDGQLINALTATKFNRGLLLNFGAKSLEYRRRVQNLCESAESADKLDKLEMKNINLTGVAIG